MSFVFNPNWQVANWFIDPVNGFDGYTGISSTFTSGTTGPLKTWAELQSRWGTSSPRLRQNTTITFMNSQPDNTDPIYFNPYMEGATVILQGNLSATQQIATGTISATGFVAKNRSTPALLQANTGATAINQIVVNTTHSSRAWTSKSLGAGVFAMSQPLAPVTVPSALITGTSVDTWASGDTVTVYAPTTIHIGELKPKMFNFTSGFTNLGLFVYQLNVNTPTNFGFVIVNPVVSFVETIVAGSVLFEGTSRQGLAVAQVNSIFIDLSGGDGSAALSIIGGRWDFGFVNTLGLSNDVIIGIGAAGNVVLQGPAHAAIGTAYIDTGTTLNIAQDVRGDILFGGSTLVLWGPGALNLQRTSRLNYPAGAGAATTSFLLTGGITINGSTTAYSINLGSGASWNGGITINAANLDAAAGASGFGGVAVVLGGGSITNGGA